MSVVCRKIRPELIPGRTKPTGDERTPRGMWKDVVSKVAALRRGEAVKVTCGSWNEARLARCAVLTSLTNISTQHHGSSLYVMATGVPTPKKKSRN